MEIAKALKFLVSLLLLLCLVPDSDEQFQTMEWPNIEFPKWDNFNNLLAFQSSRIIPPARANEGYSKTPGYTHLYFKFGPKFEVESPHPALAFIPEIHPEVPREADREINITAERFGGFGGSGDTRGYGAYEYKKRDEEPKFNVPFTDLMRVPFRKRKKPFIETFFNMLPVEEI